MQMNEVLNLTGTNIGKGKYQKSDIEKEGVEDEVLKLYKKNLPSTEISKQLEKKGINITARAINRWLEKQRALDIKNTQLESRKKFEMITTDYHTEITKILDEIKSIKEVAIQEQKLDIYVKLVSKLFQGLELLAKLMGDIKPNGSVDINIIINEINKQTSKSNKNARDLLYNLAIDVEAEIIEDTKKGVKK